MGIHWSRCTGAGVGHFIVLPLPTFPINYSLRVRQFVALLTHGHHSLTQSHHGLTYAFRVKVPINSLLVLPTVNDLITTERFKLKSLRSRHNIRTVPHVRGYCALVRKLANVDRFRHSVDGPAGKGLTQTVWTRLGKDWPKTVCCRVHPQVYVDWQFQETHQVKNPCRNACF